MSGMPATEPKITLQVLVQGEDSIRVTPFKEGSVLESTVKPSRVCPFHSALVADRAREVLALLARANAGERDLADQLVTAGQAIYLDLLPDFLKEKLEEAAVDNLLLHLDRPLLGIPWELLHDGDRFLGRRFRIGRLVSLEEERARPLQRGMTAPLSVLVVADPTGDLPAARREADELVSLFDESALFGPVTVLTGEVTLRTFRDELGRHDVLHFAGHAEPGRQGSLRLKDGLFTPRLLDQLRGRISVPGLVFLNGCGSGADITRLAVDADPLAGVSGLASSLLLSGVRHVVATLWEVRDEVARLFAGRVHGELARGGTIGSALESARQASLEQFGEDTLLWADHVLYGDPTWRPVQPGHAAFEDFSVLDGLEDKYRRELLASDPSTRLLAAAMLLRLGDRSAVPALGRELDTLIDWLAPDAPRRERRRAALVVQAMAAAAGLDPAGPPDELPDEQAVRALYERLSGAP
jgi:CHAT domain-containing protein